jgi:hypothetical protein
VSAVKPSLSTRHEAWGERQCSIGSGIGHFVICIQRRDGAEQRYRGRAQDLDERCDGG